MQAIVTYDLKLFEKIHKKICSHTSKFIEGKNHLHSECNCCGSEVNFNFVKLMNKWIFIGMLPYSHENVKMCSEILKQEILLPKIFEFEFDNTGNIVREKVIIPSH